MKTRKPYSNTVRFALLAAFASACYALICQPMAADSQVPPAETAKAPQVGETAPDFELRELKGAMIKLSAVAAKGPVVLVQLRGFPGYQCPLCTAQVGQFLGKAAKISAAKASVVLLYPGPAEGLKEHADEFVRGKDFPDNFYLLVDPDYSVVNRYGLRWDAPHETAYPATFVLNTKREVLYAKVSHGHGDRAQIEDVLAALPKD